MKSIYKYKSISFSSNKYVGKVIFKEIPFAIAIKILKREINLINMFKDFEVKMIKL